MRYTPGKGLDVPIADFAPDLPITSKGIILDANGAQPSVAGYRPLRNLVAIGDPLPFRPLGTYLAYYSDETTRLFAAVNNGGGTLAVDWYYLDPFPGTGNWIAITGPTGPALPVRFSNFGDDVLAVGGFSQVALAAAMAVNFAGISGSPSNATVIVVASGQVMVFAGQTWYTCAAGDDTDWVPNVATLAATATPVDAPGPFVAASPLYRNIVAFKKNVTFLAQQSGPPFSWSFELISTQTGTWSQGCVIQLPDAVAFLGMDDFYITTGYSPQRIPNNLKEWFFRTVNGTYIDQTLGWYDEANSILYWHFVSLQAPNPPTCDMFVSYNIRAKRWCVGHQDVSSVPYLAMAASSLPLPTSNAIIFDGNFVPKAFSGDPGGMTLTSGFIGDPNKLTQLMRLRPNYNLYPTNENLQPLATNILGKPPVITEPMAALGPDGWYNTRQYNRFHQWILGTAGDCEMTGMVYEMREAGIS